MTYNPLNITAQQNGLLGDVGSWAADDEHALYTDDPYEGGTELTSTGGYTRQVGALTWTADVGEPSISAEIDFTHSGGGYSDVANYWVVFESDGTTIRWRKPLPTPVNVTADTGAGTVTVGVTLNYGSEVD
jgi:hypothetical protein